MSRERIVALLKRPLAIAVLAIFVLLMGGEVLSPGFASPRQIVTLLTIAALLGAVAAGQNLKRWLATTGWGRRHGPQGSLLARRLEPVALLFAGH